MINRFVDDMLVNIIPSGSHSAFEIVQAENRSVIIIRCAADLSPAVGSYTDGSMDSLCKRFESL